MNTKSSPFSNIQTSIETAVSGLLQTNNQVYIATTGGGAGIADIIWQTPGASSLLIGFDFPYSQGARDAFLQLPWDQPSCCENTAIALAQTAYFKCQQICAEKNDTSSPIIGIGLTAAVVTNRDLRGGTRLFAAVRTKDGIWSVSISMEQGFLGRQGDGYVCDITVLNLLLFAANKDQVPFPSGLMITSENNLYILEDDTPLLAPTHVAASAITNNTSAAVLLPMKGEPVRADNYDFSGAVIYPVSARPLHFGHYALAKTIERLTGRRVVFEITGNNVDKDQATISDLHQTRAWQFHSLFPVILRQDAGLFVDKVQCYEGAYFMVGADTAARILDAKYYNNEDATGLRSALQIMRAYGVKIFVFDRPQPDGSVKTCGSLFVPHGFESLFVSVHGRWDVSSTQMRSE